MSNLSYENSSLKHKLFEDKLMAGIVFICAFVAILLLLGIFIFLLNDSKEIFTNLKNFKEFFTDHIWMPSPSNLAEEKLGVLPLLIGSIYVTFGAMLISIPVSLGVAILLAEILPPKLRDSLKTVVEILAGIPSVVFGFIGVMVIVPLMCTVFKLDNGYTALTGAIILSFMAMPTIISIAEDAITAVPKHMRNSSYALGANKFETICKIVVPAAKSGIIAACMLGVGRAVGETMAVLMVCGNAAIMPESLKEIFPYFVSATRTMTATIALDTGETARGTLHYSALFGIGLTLFVITFVINLVSSMVLKKDVKNG